MARHRLLLTVLSISISLLILACGGDDSDHSDGISTAMSPARAGESRPKPVKPQKPPNAVSGRFDATPGGGYTVEISYDVSEIDAAVNLADAKPGQAFVYGSALGELTVTNTTPQRNTEVELPQFYIELLWEQSRATSALASSILMPALGPRFAEINVCEVVVRGEPYCNFANVYFEFITKYEHGRGDPTTLPPGGSIQMATTAPSVAPGLPEPRPYGSLVVDEGAAKRLAQFVRATKPSLVLVYGGHEWGELQMSCAIEIAGDTFGQPAFHSGPLAALAASGQVLIDGGGLKRDAYDPLACGDAS